MVSESVTQFQAQAYKELLPSGGQVRTNIVGLKDQAREEQALVSRDFMNFRSRSYGRIRSRHGSDVILLTAIGVNV